MFNINLIGCSFCEKKKMLPCYIARQKGYGLWLNIASACTGGNMHAAHALLRLFGFLRTISYINRKKVMVFCHKSVQWPSVRWRYTTTPLHLYNMSLQLYKYFLDSNKGNFANMERQFSFYGNLVLVQGKTIVSTTQQFRNDYAASLCFSHH